MAMISSQYSSVYGKKPRSKKTKGQRAAAKRRKMAYPKFLLTPYWHDVRTRIVERECGCCKLCKRSGPLDVHHIVYTHRGDELNHLHELVALCRECHTKVHAGTHEIQRVQS